MKATYRILCITVFLIGVMTFLQASGNQSDGLADDKDTEPALPFVVSYIETHVSSDGSEKVVGGRTRYVKANGEWRLVLHGARGNELPPESTHTSNDPVYAALPEGVFAKGSGSKERRQVSEGLPDERMSQFFRSHRSLSNHAGFIRTDKLAGLEVYVLRTETPHFSVEDSYSPKTGYTPLRKVVRYTDGTEIRIEATRVEFKEIPEDLNSDLKTMPTRPKDKSN
jgi:hypothetical protein